MHVAQRIRSAARASSALRTTPLLPPHEVRRIGVFRALMLGDLLCAVPALRALRAAYPAARITLIGLPWAATLLERLRYVDDFVAFPGFPGLPEAEPKLAELPAFIARSEARRFDLVVQMHGRGDVTNPIVAGLGARHVAGFRAPGAWCPEPALFADWPEHGHEVERLLRLTDRLGVARQGPALEFPVRASDHASLARLWPAGRAPERYVCVHPGAQLASRRWPIERMADVAATLRRAGRGIVVTGVAAERALAAELLQRLDAADGANAAPVVDLVGRTTLWELGAVVERARLVVCNDTSVSHIAAALGTPSVVVSCGADVARWAPRDGQRHRVLWQPVPCRPCTHARCPTAHECATAIDAATVAGAALELLAGGAAHGA